MAKGGSSGPQETAADIALAQVAKEKMATFRTKWAPLQRKQAAQVDAMGAADSTERRQARGMATADTDVAFAGAGDKALQASSASGNVGSAGQKLGIASMGNDQASSVGLNVNQADLGVDSARVGGLASVVMQGQGKEALALQGLESQAQMARQVANENAQAALERDAGYASLAGQAAGVAAGSLFGPSNSGRGLDGPTINGGAQGGYVLPRRT